MSTRWVYYATVTKSGRPVAQYEEVDPDVVPEGVPTFASRGEAKKAYQRRKVHPTRT